MNNQPTWSPDGKWIAFDVVEWDPTDTFANGMVRRAAGRHDEQRERRGG